MPAGRGRPRNRDAYTAETEVAAAKLLARGHTVTQVATTLEQPRHLVDGQVARMRQACADECGELPVEPAEPTTEVVLAALARLERQELLDASARAVLRWYWTDKATPAEVARRWLAGR